MQHVHNFLSFIFLLFIINSCKSEDNNRTFWPNGKVQSELSYNEAGELHGLARWYYESGKLQQEANYKHNKLHGRMLRFHENGNIESEAWYVNNLRDSSFVQYDLRGKKTGVEYYLNDTLHGFFERYYSDNQPMIEGEYLHGMLHGTWLFYDNIGTVIGRAVYKNGNGIQQVFSPRGRLVREIPYNENLIHGHEKHYGPDGRIEKIVHFEFGEIIGEEFLN